MIEVQDDGTTIDVPRKIPEETTVVSAGSCGSISTDQLMAGALCTRRRAPGSPRNEEGSWPA